MRSKSEQVLGSIKRYVDKVCAATGRAPTYREIASETGIGKSSVQGYVDELVARGLLRRAGSGIESYVPASDAVAVPRLGSIPCGPLSEEFESIEEYITLPSSLVGQGEHYFLRARGDSMIGAGIADGDLVLVRYCEEAEDGDIVVALVDNEVTLKRLYRDGQRRVAVLHPENPNMADIVVSDCLIRGVATRVIKEL